MELTGDSNDARGLRRYVWLVAQASDLRGDAYCTTLEPTLSAYLALDGRLPQFPELDTALVWDECDGWAGAIETTSGENLLVVSYLGVDVLPPPRLAARFATDFLAGETPRQADPPAFRNPNSDDDLPVRLAAYAPPPAISASDGYADH